MLSLNLPFFSPNITEKEGKSFIYDVLRKKRVALTPEEWVRQHFVNYLITEKGYPEALLANEVEISLNGLSRRCDTVVYNRYLEPLVIVEYKASTVKMSQQVFDQVSRYNLSLQVGYLIVSNGLLHYCCYCDKKSRKVHFLKEIPSYDELTGVG